jgi:hypothetical protein
MEKLKAPREALRVLCDTVVQNNYVHRSEKWGQHETCREGL